MLHKRKKRSEESKDKIRGDKNPAKRLEVRKKISEAHRGMHPSEGTKRKLSESKKGKKNPFYGKKHSEKVKRRLSERYRGAKCKFWQGGISHNRPYPNNWREGVRDAIRKRDNYTCQLCGMQQDKLRGRFRKLDVHHKNYDKLNLNPENLITLCRNCHIKTNNNREFWANCFVSKLKGRRISALSSSKSTRAHRAIKQRELRGSRVFQTNEAIFEGLWRKGLDNT